MTFTSDKITKLKMNTMNNTSEKQAQCAIQNVNGSFNQKNIIWVDTEFGKLNESSIKCEFDILAKRDDSKCGIKIKDSGSIMHSDYNMIASLHEHSFFDKLIIDKWYKFNVTLFAATSDEEEPGYYVFGNPL